MLQRRNAGRVVWRIGILHLRRRSAPRQMRRTGSRPAGRSPMRNARKRSLHMCALPTSLVSDIVLVMFQSSPYLQRAQRVGRMPGRQTKDRNTIFGDRNTMEKAKRQYGQAKIQAEKVEACIVSLRILSCKRCIKSSVFFRPSSSARVSTMIRSSCV